METSPDAFRRKGWTGLTLVDESWTDAVNNPKNYALDNHLYGFEKHIKHVYKDMFYGRNLPRGRSAILAKLL